MRIAKYLNLSRTGRGGRLKVIFNEEVIVKVYWHFRYFAPVVSQAQETLEELVGYRLGKRGDVGRDDQRDALAEVAIASGIRTITDASSLPNSLPFWIYLPSPETPQ